MSISRITTAGVTDNWVEIATNTASAVTTKSFTSIPTTYSKLLLVWHSISMVSTSDLTIRFNNDATTLKHFLLTTSGSTRMNSSNIIFSQVTTGNGFGLLEIDSANTTNAKRINGYYTNSADSTTATNAGLMTGIYLATAAITQVDFISSLSNYSGTVTLYGTL